MVQSSALDSAPEEPEGYEGIAVYLPEPTTPRVQLQSSVLTISGPPHVGLERLASDEHRLTKLTIGRDAKALISRKLATFGVDRAVLFGDLDNLARDLNWKAFNLELLVTGDENPATKRLVDAGKALDACKALEESLEEDTE